MHKDLDSQEDFFRAMGPYYHREKVYPWDALGAAIVAGNGAWGASKVVVPVDAIISDYGHTGVGSTVDWYFVGVYVDIRATASKEVTWNIYRVVKISETALNSDSGTGQGANDAKIYIADTSGFLVGDTVWVKDDNTTDGELMTIDTVTENTSLNCDASMVADYTTAQNAKVYLVWRSGMGNDEYRSIWGKVTLSSTKGMMKDLHHAMRRMEAGDGLVAKAYGIEAAVTIGLSIIYDDVTT